MIDAADVVARYSAGASMGQVGAALGVSRQRIHQILQREARRMRSALVRQRIQDMAPDGQRAAFWARVRKPDGWYDMNYCWLWLGGCTAAGYGRTRNGYAHRLAWEYGHGCPIPAGVDVLHHCDNPPCVRPDHLFLGTDIDNARDRDAKGRYRGGPHAPGRGA